MLKLKLIPDGRSSLPIDVIEGGILESYLKNAENIPDQTGTPIDDWVDIKRSITADSQVLLLSVPGDISEYPGNTLKNIENSILDNRNDLKKHPDGWQYVNQNLRKK